MEKNAGKTFISHFLILGIGTAVYLIVGVIGTPIITRLVDPADYGYMSMFMVYSNIGMNVLGLGLDQALVRFFYNEDAISYKRKLLFECYVIPGAVGILIGIVYFAGCLLTNLWGITSKSLWEVFLLELNIAVMIINRYALLVLRLSYRTKAYSVIGVIQKLLYIVITIVGVLLFHNYYFEILAIAAIASTLIAAIAAVFVEKKVWFGLENHKDFVIPIDEILRFGLPLMLATGISMIFNALDKFALNFFCTLGDVGVYSSAMNLMAVFSIVRTSFNALWMPSAVEHYEKNPNDTSFYQKGNAFIAMLMVAFGAMVILLKDLFVLLLGPKYQAASEIVPFLMFEPIMYTISETTTTGIVVQKKSSYQMIVALGSLLVNFIGNWILTPVMGPKGAALSTGIAYIVFFALRTGLSNRVFKVDYNIPRFSIVIFLLFAYAYYGSAHYFSALQCIMCTVVIVSMLLLYKNYVKDAIAFAKEILHNRKIKV